MSRVVARDCAKQRDDHLCGSNQQGSRAYADRHSTEFVCIQGGSVSEREEFSQDAFGVSTIKEAVLGSAFVGEGLFWVASSGNVTDEVWKAYKVVKTGRQLFVKLKEKHRILLEQVLIALKEFEPPPI